MDFESHFIRAILASVRDLFSSMVPLEIDFGLVPQWLEDGDLTAMVSVQPPPPMVESDWVGVIDLQGEIQGSVSVLFPYPVAVAFTRLLLEEDSEPEPDDVLESVGEMTNMIAGGIKTALCTAEDLFDISLPRVFNLSLPKVLETEVYLPGQHQVHIQIPVQTPVGDFAVLSSLSRGVVG